MKRLLVILLTMMPLLVCANSGFYTDFFSESFYGEVWWLGQTSRFTFSSGWLRSDLPSDNSHGSIVVESAIMSDASWSFFYRYEQPLSDRCFARYYMAAGGIDLNSAQGYYVQLGDAEGRISLVFKGSGEAETLCTTEPLLTGGSGKIFVEITRSSEGEWQVLTGEHGGTLRCSATHNGWHNCRYTGFYAACGDEPLERTCHYFDELEVYGYEEEPQGTEDPEEDPSGDPSGQDPSVTPPPYDAVEAEPGTLLINEIMFHPAADGQEYVEVINLTDDVIDLSGVTVTTRTAKGKFNTGNKFPEGSYVLPGEVAALTANATMLAEQFGMGGDTTHIWSTRWRQQLNNTSQTLFLLNSDKTLCYDSVYYHKNYHHNLVSDDSGVSLERMSTRMESMDASAWHSAAAPYYGTPGQPNSQNVDVEAGYDDVLRVEPEAFSPNGDGTDDVCVIYYNMPREGYTATLRLFTPSGQLVAVIADNVLLAKQGYLTWDGTTSRGGTAQIGIYALVMQATHPDGKAMKKKLPVVVVDR